MQSKQEILRAVEKPESLPLHEETIPQTLKEARQWVVWRWVQKNSQWAKQPYSAATGLAQKWNQDLSTFGMVLGKLESDQFDGPGFCFSADSDFAGIDLDNCRNPNTGEIAEWAQAIIQAVDSYTEVSPSQTGVKIYLRTSSIPANGANNRVGIEFFKERKFFTVTGHWLPDTPATIEQRDEIVKTLYTQYIGEREQRDSGGEEADFGYSRSDCGDYRLIHDALSAIGPAYFDDYDGWIKVGMSLWSADKSLLQEWIDWSRKSEKFKSEEDCRKRWESFDAKDITIATLYHIADEEGWKYYDSMPQRGYDLAHKAYVADRKRRDEEEREYREAIHRGGGLTIPELIWQNHMNRSVIKEQQKQIQRIESKDSSRESSKEADKGTERRELTLLNFDTLLSGDYVVEYLVERVLVKSQPCIIAGASKSMKTSIMLDLALSLAAGGRFLGYFPTTRKARVGVISAESGMGTLQETVLRITNKAQFNHADLKENFFISEDCIRFDNAVDLGRLERAIKQYGLEVCFLDPVYLMCPGADANNLMIQGSLLDGVNSVFRETGCTPVMVHHTKKNRQAKQYDPPELGDIAWSGFGEWARQWILIGRREPYESDGKHELWFSTGGSAGHSGLWGLFINEGTRDNQQNRTWTARLEKLDEIKEQKKQQKETEKQREKERKILLAADVEEVKTMTDILTEAGMNNKTGKPIFEKLVGEGRLVKEGKGWRRGSK